jgi:steroid 5-alpha reductase family enzyme
MRLARIADQRAIHQWRHDCAASGNTVTPMVLMFMVRIIDVVVRAVRLMASGSAAGIALLLLVVVLFAAGAVSVVVLGAWLLATMQNNHGWVDAVLPCALGGTCPAL